MRFPVLALLSLIALPSTSFAQTNTTTAVATATTPEAVAAARPVIDQIWPLGTYRRMMNGTMSKMMDSLMESMMGMRARDLVGANNKAGNAAGDKTVGELSETADPNFRERMKITFDVMFGEMVPLMDKVEPTVRQSLVDIYARSFSVSQLEDMGRFFATPSGKAYAEKSMLVFMEPEMIQGMSAFIPEVTKAMPAIIQKVEAATSHLPPPKRSGTAKAPADERM